MGQGEDDGLRLANRLAQLEQRVAILEAEPRAPSGTPRSPSVLDPARFWALEGLKQGADLDALLEADWSLAADVLGALGHPVRLVVLRQVLRGVQTVAELGSTDGLRTSGQLYHHVRQLVAAGWLRSPGRGRYEVPAARVVPLLVILAAAQR